MSTLHEYVSPVAWVGPHRELVVVVSLVGVSLLGVPPAGVRRVRGLDAAIHDARRPGNPVFWSPNSEQLAVPLDDGIRTTWSRSAGEW